MRPSRSSRDSDLVSSQTERRGEIFNDEFSLPGLVAGSRESNEDIFGASVSDDDDDAEPIPPFLLPGESLNVDIYGSWKTNLVLLPFWEMAKYIGDLNKLHWIHYRNFGFGFLNGSLFELYGLTTKCIQTTFSLASKQQL